MVLDDWLPLSVCAGLRQDALAAQQSGAFKPAGVGRGAQHATHTGIRSDAIAWLDDAAATSAQQPFFNALEAMRLQLNQALLLGLFRFEGHFACYPPGAAYGRHRDTFVGPKSRLLSLVYYLNPDWQPDEGGVLRLYLADEAVHDIAPEANRLVLFLSEQIEHEVLPANRDRWSLTGWFRVREG